MTAEAITATAEGLNRAIDQLADLKARVEALESKPDYSDEFLVDAVTELNDRLTLVECASPSEPPNLSNEDITKLMASGQLMWKDGHPVDIRDVIKPASEPPISAEDLERVNIILDAAQGFNSFGRSTKVASLLEEALSILTKGEEG